MGSRRSGTTPFVKIPFGLNKPHTKGHLHLQYLKKGHISIPDFCICENKGADQLRCNPEADQRLCFRYTDSTIPLLSKSEISRLYPSSVTAQHGLCRTLRKPVFSQRGSNVIGLIRTEAH